MADFTYLKGINTLRFFAAFFVIISHANVSLLKLGIYKLDTFSFLHRGEDAVDFFFTLSGFLITYLLLLEIKKTGTVSVRRFYLRRIFRIWPLYFLVIFIGFFFLTVVYKQVYGVSYFTFPVVKGILYFIFFLPNYMAVNYQVGLLYPLWSIGVEEQFYLMWAPFIRFFRKYTLLFIVVFTVAATVLYFMITNNQINVPVNIREFLLTQKFFMMAIGGLFAIILFRRFEWYNNSIFTWKFVQLAVISIILWHYIIGFSFSSTLWFKVVCCFLYGLLILNVSVITSKIFDIDKLMLNYLGVISYGLYMYHMIIDYLLRTIAAKFGYMLPAGILVPLYYIILLGLTIVTAGISYKYFEAYFLRIKQKLHTDSR